MSEMEHKTLRTDTVVVDEDKGIVEAIFAVFGNVDMGGDRIHPGAFTKTFSERGGKVKVLDAHNTNSTASAVGKTLELREVGPDALPDKTRAMYPEATGGAYAKMQILLDTPEGAGVFKRLKSGVIDEWSFGYDTIQHEYTKDAEGNTIRELKEVRLHEISPVLWGMNDATATVSAKAKWSTAYINDLPDSAFLYIEPGGEKDEEGKTVPRSLRHFPYKDANGDVDLPHLRNAIARIPQSSLSDDLKERLQARARRILERENAKALEAQVAALTKRVEALERKEPSLEERLRALNEALEEAYPRDPETGYWRYYVRETFDGYVIVDARDEEYDCYRVAYSRNENGDITFAPRESWVGGTYQFVPGAKAASGADSNRERATDEAGPVNPPTSEMLTTLELELAEIDLLEADDGLSGKTS